MLTRYLLLLGLVFAITLGVIVGDRLPAESLAVMVGVVAGVAASIPTSLIVVWFALRTASLQAAVSVPAPATYSAPPEPRIVVVTQPARPEPVYQSYAGYAPPAYAPSMAVPSGARTVLVPRSVVVGDEGELDAEPSDWAETSPEEMVWQR